MSFYLIDNCPKKKEYLHFRLEKDLLLKIKERANLEQKTVSDMVRNSLREAIDG